MSDAPFSYERRLDPVSAQPRPPFEYPGVEYHDFISRLSQLLAPSSYMEIGTNTGASLAQIRCDAICIDPSFKIQDSPLADRQASLFFQMESDAFFAKYDVLTFFPRGVDLAFLDGMHWFEFLLRDFMNTERVCHTRSLVLLHDCIPQNARMAERLARLDPEESERTRFAWTGDVWRVLPILKKYRPDLQIRILDCPPTGLVAITRLDANNETLSRNYHAILEEFSDLELDEFGLENLRSLFPTLDTRKISRPEILSSVFSLR